MIFSSGSFWGGVFLVGASVGIGSFLLPEQIFESLELTSAKTRSEEASSNSEISKEPQPTSTPGTEKNTQDTNSGKGSQSVPTASQQTTSEKTGCVIHKLMSSTSKPWKFEKVGNGDKFLKEKEKTDAYKRIKAACDGAKGNDILIRNKKQSLWSWWLEWDYDVKDQSEVEFKTYLSGLSASNNRTST
ncbi:hypothetical protein MHC_03385 [Mycoplasma haemocanis str. Illinois]|uniref:Uncharacterized protein n=1 Tax=Mycoplasma haemocanis (strain Illinois) TaxID=1111676 RepID=H6N7B5_MYCHN|nr:hypothetical protein [Mycoplasma haemocanis]AEW45537.1 hypothetical protein MHC_03385 [Mycoplasma haemocanis str. Illinois]